MDLEQKMEERATPIADLISRYAILTCGSGPWMTAFLSDWIRRLFSLVAWLAFRAGYMACLMDTGISGSQECLTDDSDTLNTGVRARETPRVGT